MITAPKIESSDLSIEQVYKDFYVVPDYQREYVWKEEDVRAFADDIHNEFYGPKGDLVPEVEYFIGSTVVCRNRNGTYDLIDGQQRMTTIYLFLCAIRDFIRANGGEPIDSLHDMVFANRLADDGSNVRDHRLSLQYEDSHGVLEYIADSQGEVAAAAEPTKSVRCIKDAYRTLMLFLSERFQSDVPAVRRFFVAFVRRVKLIRIVTPNLSHALKVFETVNDRGVGLTAMDLLKNLLFMRTRSQDYPKLKNQWKALTKDLDGCKEKHLRFLRYFVMSRYADFRTASGKPLREDEIYDWFGKHTVQTGLDADPMGFAAELAKAGRDYRQFASGKAPDGTPIVYLDNIQSLSGKARQHFILMLAGRHLPGDALTELAKHLESLFFVYTVTREPTKNFEWMFGDWAADLRQAKAKGDVQAIIQARIKPLIQAKSRDFDFAMRELSSDRIQKYRLKYILAKIAQHLDQLAWQDADNTQQLGHYMDAKLEVEHILPQRPTAQQRAEFDQPAHYGEWLNRLGNLSLLEKNLNASVSNENFDRKREAYVKSRVVMTRAIATRDGFGRANSLTRALEQLSSYNKWTSVEIAHRQESLASLARQVWLVDESPSAA